ncbi:uncharacterized protein N7477_002127 [Penicillium maclennaniae]|uniref:uncharacterized protein n=1 Tax=Penicillium maclennaniae TaxID=1343394 RepID=UPI002540AAC5|nr:uncharacterized protein N7477_002127 [Penicillium maclennaniae]KAJ5676494.1 hypothetical protein N7477_002127 [Penicillium maclennaniae]
MTVQTPKSAHVNMTVDTIIANLPFDGLRAVLRGMLASKPDCTGTFEEQTENFIHETASRFSKSVNEGAANDFFHSDSSFEEIRKRVCCMVGCGLCYEAIPLLQYLVERVSGMNLQDCHCIDHEFAALEGLIVQTLTAVQKTLVVVTGLRQLSAKERLPLNALLQSLVTCKLSWERVERYFPLERGLEATTDLLEPCVALELPIDSSALSGGEYLGDSRNIRFEQHRNPSSLYRTVATFQPRLGNSITIQNDGAILSIC